MDRQTHHAGPLQSPPRPLPPAALGGRALRLILLDELRRRGQSSVAELVPVITAYQNRRKGRLKAKWEELKAKKAAKAAEKASDNPPAE